VKKGDFVLVHAAAGGTGQYIVQMAKNLGGIVIGTVGSEEKVEIAKNVGCDHVINYKTHDIEQEVLRITNNHKCQVSVTISKLTQLGQLRWCWKEYV
jgi:NADPH2:quinone reductase